MNAKRKNEATLDWRTSVFATLAKALPAAYPGGPSHEAGSRLLLTCLGDAGTLGKLAFVAPSPAALSLSLAHKAALDASPLMEKLKFTEAVSPEGLIRHVSIESASTLFDFFELSMVSVFFSYQALEAFCNDEIFRKAPEPIELNLKKGVNKFTRREAERQLSTADKLGTLLPKILSMPTPKGKTIWEGFRQLEDARDNVVHLKNQTVNDPNNNSEKVLFTLLAKQPLYWPKVANDLLSYFISEPVPNWYKELKSRFPEK